MIESFLVVFREGLEITLIVGLVIAFLKQNHLKSLYSLVFLSILSALIASMGGAYLFSFLESGFTGFAEQLFEGVTMIIASLFLTYMIGWLYHQKNSRHILENKLKNQITSSRRLGLFFIVFFAILREGVETTLFINAIAYSNQEGILMGGLLGLLASIGVGYFLFILELKLPIKKFFQWSGFLLIFFAAGLLAHGVHELQEAGVVPLVIEHWYDINFILNEKSLLGEMAKGLFGYNANPSLIETLTYVLYLAIVIILFNRLPKKRLNRA